MRTAEKHRCTSTGMPRVYPFDDLAPGSEFFVDDPFKFGVVRTIASMRGVNGKKFSCTKQGGVLIVRRIA